jgi:hypothetical protein
MKIKLDISLPTHQFNFPQILNLMSVQGPITLIQANNMCSQVPRLPHLFILLFKNITAITTAYTCSVLSTCHCASRSSHTWLFYRLLTSQLGNVRFSAFPNSIIFAQSFVKIGHVLKYTSTGIHTHTHTRTHAHDMVTLPFPLLIRNSQGTDRDETTIFQAWTVCTRQILSSWLNEGSDGLGTQHSYQKYETYAAFWSRCSVVTILATERLQWQMWRRNWVRGFLLQ